jgi:hypothetical protein
MRYAILLLLLLTMAVADIFMVVEYESTHDRPKNFFNITFKTVELKVTLLGCDDGYYEAVNTPKLICSECICNTFNNGRSEQFRIAP